MQPDRDAHLYTLLNAYLAAEYRWHDGKLWQPIHIGQRAPIVEAVTPATVFGLLSAWNPQSVRQPEHVNRIADRQLQALLETKHVKRWPASAAAQDGDWQEPAWLVADLSAYDHDELAQRFGQLGTLHWRRGEVVRLRMHLHLPMDGIDISIYPHVEWLK